MTWLDIQGMLGGCCFVAVDMSSRRHVCYEMMLVLYLGGGVYGAPQKCLCLLQVPSVSDCESFCLANQHAACPVTPIIKSAML